MNPGSRHREICGQEVGAPRSIWVAAAAAVLFLTLWYGLGLVRILTGGTDDDRGDA